MIDNPAKFDWVKARAQCSVASVFKALELGAKADVESMKALFPKEAGSFSVVVGRNTFAVVRVIDAMTGDSQTVDFSFSGTVISIRDGDRTITAGITLNNEGLCKLKVGEGELDHWQLRRMALERLFFGPL